MTIDRIGYTDPIQPGKKPGSVGSVTPRDKSDSISLSSEAIEKGEMYQVMELISSSSDISEERIAELKQKINDPAYINDRIINATADKIIESFGL